MAIDDPIEATQKQFEDLERTPVTEHVAKVVGALIPGGAIISEFISRHRQQAQDLLLSCVADQLRSLIGRFDELEESHQKFLQEDFMGLVMDGLKKSETIRSQDRVRRIANILGHAATKGPSVAADDTEEMMRIAMELGDAEVRLLETLVVASAVGRLTRTHPHDAPVSIATATTPAVGVHTDEQTSMCLKLGSFGLVVAMRDMDKEVRTFGVLPKASMFIEFVRFAGSSL